MNDPTPTPGTVACDVAGRTVRFVKLTGNIYVDGRKLTARFGIAAATGHLVLADWDDSDPTYFEIFPTYEDLAKSIIEGLGL